MLHSYKVNGQDYLFFIKGSKKVCRKIFEKFQKHI